MLRGIVSVAIILGLSIAAQAAVTTSFTSSPTPNPFSGYTTYDVTLTSDTGNLTGFEVSFNGAMLQGPSPTYGVFLPDTPPSPLFDSCFLFTESQLAVGSSSESGTSLIAVFAFSGGLGDPNVAASINIAQIIIADGYTVEMSGNVTVGTTEVSFANTTIPEPATISLLAIGGIAMLRRKR